MDVRLERLSSSSSNFSSVLSPVKPQRYAFAGPGRAITRVGVGVVGWSLITGHTEPMAAARVMLSLEAAEQLGRYLAIIL